MIVFLNNHRGQTMLEYTIILGLIVTALMVMSPMFKRSIQGMVKVVADQIGVKKNSDQSFDEETGHMDRSYSASRSTMGKQTTQVLNTISYTYGDTAGIATNTVLNLGFANETPQ